MTELNLFLNYVILLSLTIIFIFYTTSFIIISIICLIKESNIKKNCLQSNLWYYLLIIVISKGLFFIFNIFRDKNSKINFILIYIFFIYSIGMICWGGYELSNINCINKNTILYKISLINWIISLILIVFFILNKIFINLKFNKKEKNTLIIYEDTHNILDLVQEKV
jgi:hypothetical protein